MAETVDFNVYISYVLISVYYVIMLRLWLPPPPSEGHEEAGGDKTVVPDGALSRAALRRIAPPAASDDGASASSTEARDEPLERIRAADEHFEKGAFLSGASKAYELVVNAYANGDISKLNGLLGSEVATAFHDAIAERRNKREFLTLNLVGIRELDIVDSRFEADRAEITVRFVADLVSVMRAADNSVVDGDPNEIVAVTDLWTFARRVPSFDPNWKVVATDGA